VTTRRARIVGPGRAGPSLAQALGEVGGWEVAATTGRRMRIVGRVVGAESGGRVVGRL